MNDDAYLRIEFCGARVEVERPDEQFLAVNDVRLRVQCRSGGFLGNMLSAGYGRIRSDLKNTGSLPQQWSPGRRISAMNDLQIICRQRVGNYGDVNAAISDLGKKLDTEFSRYEIWRDNHQFTLRAMQ